jgi:hypothetical protein
MSYVKLKLLAVHHEYMCGFRVTASPILKRGTKYRRMVSFRFPVVLPCTEEQPLPVELQVRWASFLLWKIWTKKFHLPPARIQPIAWSQFGLRSLGSKLYNTVYSVEIFSRG